MPVPVGLTWTVRPEPLRPTAVLGRGSVATALSEALAGRLESGIDLEIHAAQGVVLAIGQEGDLPWVDGATWLGRDGPLLMPTTLRPALDTGLVARAIQRRVGPDAGWIVVTPDELLTGRHATGAPDAATLKRLIAPSEPA
jgi:hypothetical protein